MTIILRLQTAARASLVIAAMFMFAPLARAQVTPTPPIWICESNKTQAEKDRRDDLRTHFAQKLQDYRVRTGAVARLRYDKAVTLSRAGSIPPAAFARVCAKFPELCRPENKPSGPTDLRDPGTARLLCQLNPRECKKSAGMTWLINLSFDDAVLYALNAARSAVRNATPLPARAILISQTAAHPRLAQLPPVVRDAIAEYALAQALEEEGAEQTSLYVRRLVNRECAFRLHEHYDEMVNGFPGVSLQRIELDDAFRELRPFGLPNETSQPFSLSGMANVASFLAGFKSSAEAPRDIAQDIMDATDTLVTNMRFTDQQITDRDLEITPWSGNEFYLLWLTHPLAAHRITGWTILQDAIFNITLLDDAIALLRSGLTRFPEGGGHGSDLFRLSQLETVCGGSGGVQSTLSGVLDADGRLSTWLNTQIQSGLRRDDAAEIAGSAGFCALRWALKTTLDLKLASFTVDDSLRIEMGQHSTQPAELKQAFQRSELAHDRGVTNAYARAMEIDQIVP